jgi:hypothetical protein
MNLPGTDDSIHAPTFLDGGDPDESDSLPDKWLDLGMPSEVPYPFPVPCVEQIGSNSLRVWRWIVAMAPQCREGQEYFFVLVMQVFHVVGRFKDFLRKTRHFLRATYQSAPTFDPDFSRSSEDLYVEEEFMTHLAIAGFDEFWARELERWFRDQSQYGPEFRNWLQPPEAETEPASSIPAPEAPMMDYSVPSVEMVDEDEVVPTTSDVPQPENT